MRGRVIVTLKEGVLDPQGKAVAQALESLGFRGVQDVRVGKVIEIVLDTESPAEAEATIREMCRRLLANPVIEDYRVDVEP